MSINPYANGDPGGEIRAKINAAIEVANAAVVGPGSATAGHFPRFVGGTGRQVEDGGPLTIGDVEGLGDALDEKADGSAVTAALAGKADAAAVASALAGKSDVGHGHAWGAITDKPTTFAPSAHTHTAAEISDASVIGKAGLTASTKLAARDAIGAAGPDTFATPALAVQLSAVAAVDTFIYDTRLDTDGGAWRYRCRHTSWYNEAKNTGDRGRRGDFPLVAGLVLESAQLQIYDLTDIDPATGAPRLWASYNRRTTAGASAPALGGSGQVLYSVFACEGRVFVGSGSGLIEFNFPRDLVFARGTISLSTRFGRIADANTFGSGGNGFETGVLSGALVAVDVKRVHARVLPGAPLDDAGLPIPTIAAATSGGVSVIHPSGQVVDITRVSGFHACEVLPNGDVAIVRTDASIVEVGPLPYADITNINWRVSVYSDAAAPMIRGAATKLGWPAVASSTGVTIFGHRGENYSEGMAANISHTFATAWLPGDTRRAWLCEGGSSVGGTITDRSYKSSALTVVGSPTLAAVATGADLSALSGFSASNYLTQAYSADLDFGDADFAVAFWLKEAPNSAVETIIERDSTSSNQRITVQITSGGILQFITDDGTDVVTCSSVAVVDDGFWHHVVAVMRGTTMELWIDGLLVATANGAAVDSLSNASAILRVGVDCQSSPANPLTNGSLALVRLSATAPTPKQIRRMYLDESALFIVGARAFLGGASSAVASLSADPVTGQVAVATADGVSIFRGLSRVAYLDTAAVSALTSDAMAAAALRGSHVLLAGASNYVAYREETWAIDEAARVRGQAQAPIRARGVTTDATPTTLAPRLHVGERELLRGRIRVVGRQYGATASERFSTVLDLGAYRDAGGNVTLSIVADDQHGARWDTTGAAAIVTTVETTSTLDAAVVVDTTAQTLAVQVTGKASTRMVWTAEVEGLVRISEDLEYAA